MPITASRRFVPIDPRYLGTMTVIETLDSESTLAIRMARLKALWTQNDPPFGAAYDVEGLEFDPIKVNQEVNTFFETTVRDRVNQAARAVTLAYATGTDLDGIGSRYPGGVPRLPIVDTPRPYADAPLDWESDDRYRTRLWLSPNAFSTAGAAGAYLFWALTADPTLRDATATVYRPSPYETPTVVITCLADDPANPIPSAGSLIKVHRQLHLPDIKPLTDIVSVVGPNIVDVDIEANLWFYPAADQVATTAAAKVSVATLLEQNRYLDMDLNVSAIGSAASVGGVQNVHVLNPLTDQIIGPTQIVRVLKDPVLNPFGVAQ